MAKIEDFDYRGQRSKWKSKIYIYERRRQQVSITSFYCAEALSGKTKIDIVYESDNVLAFHHTKPVFKDHIVVIPKKHIHDLANVSDEDLVIVNEIMRVCRDIIKTLKFEDKGGRVLTNLGKFQDTPHLHFHVVTGKMRSLR